MFSYCVSKTVPLPDLDGERMEPRTGHSSTFFDKSLYFVGPSSRDEKTIYLYRFNSNLCSVEAQLPISSEQCMPKHGRLLSVNDEIIYFGEKSPLNMYCMKFCVIHYKENQQPEIIQFDEFEPFRHFGICVIDNLVYLHGGIEIHPLNVTSKLYVYDPSSKNLSLLQDSSIALNEHDMFAINNSKVLLVSGIDDDAETNHNIYIYDIEQNSHEILDTIGENPMRSVYYKGCVFFKSTLFVINYYALEAASDSSEDEDNENMCRLYMLSLINKTWTSVPLFGMPPTCNIYDYTIHHFINPQTCMDSLILLFGIDQKEQFYLSTQQYLIELPAFYSNFQSNMVSSPHYFDMVVDFSYSYLPCSHN